MATARVDTTPTFGSEESSRTSGHYVTQVMRSRSDYTITPRASFPVHAERGDGGWIVTESRTGIFGFGDTRISALRDLRDALREHADVLERSAELSAGLREQLDYLRSRL